MIKKLFIALVALSFLVGNFAFGDNNPNNEVSLKQPMDYASTPSAAAYLPFTSECTTEDWTCSDLSAVNLYGIMNTSGAPLDGDWWKVTTEFDPHTAETGCYVDQIGFVLYDYGTQAGPVRVSVCEGGPAPYGTVLYTVDIAYADLQFYPNIHYLNSSTPGWPVGGITFADATPIYVVLEAVDPADMLVICAEDDLVENGGTCDDDIDFMSLAYNYYGDVGEEYWDWGYFISGYQGSTGYDFINWHIYADICCDQFEAVCTGNQDWPTLQGSYARTGYSSNSIGDLTNLRILWEYQGTNYVVWGHPIVANENVYVAFYDEVVCLNLYSGARIWGTGDHTDYAAFMAGTQANNLRTVPTVDAGLIYFGTGASSYTEGVVCADAATGDTVWVRHTDLGSGLPSALGPTLVGEFNYCAPLIIGDVLVIGNSFGELYGLNKNTGADVWHVTFDAGVWQAMTTDGTYLFVGTSDGSQSTGGNIYRMDPTDGTITHTYDGDDTVLEGWTASLVYLEEDDAIIANGTRMANTASPYTEGLLRKLAAADLSDLWGAPVNTMDPFLVAPNVMPFPYDRITVNALIQPTGSIRPALPMLPLSSIQPVEV